MPAKKELTRSERVEVIKLRREGQSFNKIASIFVLFINITSNPYFLVKLGISKTCAYDTFKKYDGIEDLSSKKRSGRPPILSARDLRNLKRIITETPSLSSQMIAANASLPTISPQSIRRNLLKLGYKSYVAKKKQALSKLQMKKRLEWCIQHQYKNEEFWKGVLFSDETMIELVPSNYASYRIRRLSDSNPFQSKFIRQIYKHPLKVMVWGSFSFSGLKSYKIINGYMNADEYIKTLENGILDVMNNSNNSIHTFQDDNAPCHRSKRVKEWFRVNGISRFDWPSSSPDLNPIENLWTFLKKKIIRKAPNNKKNLISAIERVWTEEIPIQLIENLIKSMSKRIKMVIKSKGAWIKY